MRNNPNTLCNLLALALVFLVAACGSGGSEAAKGGRKPVFPVEVAPVEGRTVEYAINSVGTVDAYEEILVTARVKGVIEKVNFREGQTVKPDEVLVEIEPQTYRNNVESAKGRVSKAQSAFAEATRGLEIREDANKKTADIYSKDEINTWKNKVAGAKADLAVAEADAKQADLDLKNAHVTAPIAGVIQTRSVKIGDYVQPGAQLATLIVRNPLILRFSVTETESSYLKKTSPVTFTVRDSPNKLRATITHIAASADQRSRMVPITAEVNSEDSESARPGQFAIVRVVTGSRDNAPAIPQTAVRASEKGFLAFVVEGNVAKMRVLTLGLRTEDGRVEVREGLKPGEKLVVRGAEALFDGAEVKAESGKPPAKKKEEEEP